MLSLRKGSFPALIPALLLLSTLACSSPESTIQTALSRGSGVVQLPDGTTTLSRELKVPPNSAGLEIAGGKDSVLRAGPNFDGRALIVIQNASRIKLRDFHLAGNRTEVPRPADIPPAASAFLSHFTGNGVLIDDSRDIEISGVSMRELSGFAVLASRVKKIHIDKINVEECGGINSRGRNNTTGGVLFEEGTDDFSVTNSQFRKVTGNAIWTHSTYLSPRNYRGLIKGNEFDQIGRDAVQIGHANRVRVENNHGRYIGYPFDRVDVEGLGTPVGIDTAGKVDEGVYTHNRFEEINGKCIDLDGFHDGEVSENTCINKGPATDYPNGHYALVMNNANQSMESQLIVVRDNVFDGTRFGGIFVIGKNHKITGNKLTNLNKGHCNDGLPGAACSPLPDQPQLTEAGIYLGTKAERSAPAMGVLVDGNEISGYKMAANCVLLAPNLSPGLNQIRNNKCKDE